MLWYSHLVGAVDGLALFSPAIASTGDVLTLLRAWHLDDGLSAESTWTMYVHSLKVVSHDALLTIDALFWYPELVGAVDGMAPFSRATTSTNDILMLLLAQRPANGPPAAPVWYEYVCDYRVMSYVANVLWCTVDGCTCGILSAVWCWGCWWTGSL